MNNLLNSLPLVFRTPTKNEEAIIKNLAIHAFFVGHILGDGSFHTRDENLAVDQASFGLTAWYFDFLKENSILSKTKQTKIQKVSRTRVDKITKRQTKTESFRFATSSFCLKTTGWLETFYTTNQTKRRKKVPENIAELFYMPFSLAVWFLGDGWFDKINVCFAAGDWPVDECELMQKCLEKNFGLKTSLVFILNDTEYQSSKEIANLPPSKKQKIKVHRFTVKKESYNQFYKLVNPFIKELEVFLSLPEQKQKGILPLNQDDFLKRKILPLPK